MSIHSGFHVTPWKEYAKIQNYVHQCHFGTVN